MGRRVIYKNKCRKGLPKVAGQPCCRSNARYVKRGESRAGYISQSNMVLHGENDLYSTIMSPVMSPTELESHHDAASAALLLLGRFLWLEPVHGELRQHRGLYPARRRVLDAWHSGVAA